jgi:hypothetical protein
MTGEDSGPSLADARGAVLFSWRTSLTLVTQLGERLGTVPAEAALWFAGLEPAVNAAIERKG